MHQPPTKQITLPKFTFMTVDKLSSCTNNELRAHGEAIREYITQRQLEINAITTKAKELDERIWRPLDGPSISDEQHKISGDYQDFAFKEFINCDRFNHDLIELNQAFKNRDLPIPYNEMGIAFNPFEVFADVHKSIRSIAPEEEYLSLKLNKHDEIKDDHESESDDDSELSDFLPMPAILHSYKSKGFRGVPFYDSQQNNKKLGCTIV